jgi:PAS domain S-box-containing protein
MEEKIRKSHDNLELKVKKRTAELKYERDNFSNIINSTLNGIYILNHEYDLEYVNPVLEKDFGLFKDKKCYEYLYGENDPCSDCRLREAFNGKTVKKEIPLTRAGKTYDALSMPLVNPDGSNSVLTILNDVTEHKKAEKALQESEQRLNLAQKVANVGTFEWNIQNDVNTWTPELEAIYGLSPETFSGTRKAWEELIHSEDRTEAIQCLNHALETGGPGEGEWRVIWPDGSVHWLHGRWQIFKDAEGNPLRMIGVNIDINKLKQAQNQLKETINELKRSNNELQQFAYITSHDLQEPLRTISSFTQLLERRYKGQLDSDADEFMDYIVDAAKRMQNLINDLLHYSRVTTKAKEFKPVNVEEVLDTALQNLKSSIDENNAEITHNNLPTITADASQLVQLFQNLIGNAIKFRKPDKPPIINVSSHKDEENNEYIFSVQDNGIGMEPQYAERIFVIFQRLHTRDVYSGTGIGLATSKRIVERHGGHIWVESELGVGSTFYFTIPIMNE